LFNDYDSHVFLKGKFGFVGFRNLDDAFFNIGLKFNGVHRFVSTISRMDDTGFNGRWSFPYYSRHLDGQHPSQITLNGINERSPSPPFPQMPCSLVPLPRSTRTSDNAIAPTRTTLAQAIALNLPTHRAIAPLKKNLGQGDRLSSAGNAIALLNP
jgi:hypothetical protein